LLALHDVAATRNSFVALARFGEVMALCFEIRINGGGPVIAGLEDINVLSACVTYAHQEVEIESSHPAAPAGRRRDDPELVERQERQYYEHLKRQYESK
jgi:hypothetical protein